MLYRIPSSVQNGPSLSILPPNGAVEVDVTKTQTRLFVNIPASFLSFFTSAVIMSVVHIFWKGLLASLEY